jgi:hypothetical protein
LPASVSNKAFVIVRLIIFNSILNLREAFQDSP